MASDQNYHTTVLKVDATVKGCYTCLFTATIQERFDVTKKRGGRGNALRVYNEKGQLGHLQKKQDSNKAFQWKIRNLPYPLNVYSVKVNEDNNSVTIRTSNKKQRAKLKLDQRAITVAHTNNTGNNDLNKTKVDVSELGKRASRRQSLVLKGRLHLRVFDARPFSSTTEVPSSGTDYPYGIQQNSFLSVEETEGKP